MLDHRDRLVDLNPLHADLLVVHLQEVLDKSLFTFLEMSLAETNFPFRVLVKFSQ